MTENPSKLPEYSILTKARAGVNDEKIAFSI
jgi:hypothetical protein